MLSAPIRILLVAALCIALLIGLVVREGMARDGGQEVVMAMAAIDPRSILSGHFVIIDLREATSADTPCPPQGENSQWVALAPEDGRHRVVGAAATRAEALALGAIAVRGEITCTQGAPATDQSDGFPGWIGADVGVSRYYAAQSEALRIERVIREQTPGEDTRVYAILCIGDDGRARLKGLIVDDQRLELGWS